MRKMEGYTCDTGIFSFSSFGRCFCFFCLPSSQPHALKRGGFGLTCEDSSDFDGQSGDDQGARSKQEAKLCLIPRS